VLIAINTNLVEREDVVIDSVVRQISVLYTSVSHCLFSSCKLLCSQYLQQKPEPSVVVLTAAKLYAKGVHSCLWETHHRAVECH